MEGSAPPPSQPTPAAAAQQHSNLIRTDQVQKLPHLNDQQKAAHTQAVRHLWEILNSRDPQSNEYQTAHMKLTQISQSMMKGMRQYQQNRQQAIAQQNAALAAAPAARVPPTNPQSMSQLLPQIQRRVENLQFFFPPSITKDGMQQWLPEARLRYGIALQKQEVGRARIAELRQQLAARQVAGNLTQEELQEFKNRQLAAEKTFREGSEFLNKFREQQEQFKQSQLAKAGAGPPGGAPPGAAPPGAQNAPAAGSAPMQPGQIPPPGAHTINSAVNAARNNAGGQVGMSPAMSQPGQAVPAQAGAPPNAPSQQQQQQHQPLPPQLQSQNQPQQGPQVTPGAQVPISQTPNPDGSTPTPTASQPVHPPGPPRPLSHQAAISQAAQNYNVSQQQPQNLGQGTPPSHTHPQGYNPNRPAENSARNINMAIPKNLNVPPPEPVAMAPARPTLSGGPSHGAMGMMGQPAIQKHPGYVLEGDGQRVLSKKMLDILVRQVTGGGEGEGLTPDAEEVS